MAQAGPGGAGSALRDATLIATLVMLIAVLSAEPLGIDEEAFLGGWQVPALITAIVEAVLVVGTDRYWSRSGTAN